MNRFSLFNIAELLVESPLICWPLRLWEAVWASELRHSSGKWVEITSIQPHRALERSKIIYTWSSAMDIRLLFTSGVRNYGFKTFFALISNSYWESNNFAMKVTDGYGFIMKIGECKWTDAAEIDIKFEPSDTTLGCCLWLARPISCEPPQQF